jgi:glycosyltransferase involved in cell wall biosynthesis
MCRTAQFLCEHRIACCLGTPRAYRAGVSGHGQLAEYLQAAYGAGTVPVVRVDGNAPLRDVDNLDGVNATIVLGADASLDDYLLECGLRAAFVGWTRDAGRLAVLDPHLQPRVAAPANYRVAAIIPTFNEVDVIRGTLEYLIQDGIAVHVIDNWSTDGTLDLVRDATPSGLVTSERFPRDGAPLTYDLRAIMTRVEEVGAALNADWIVLHDADERRRAPWRDASLRDALYAADQAGFNCVDHVTLNFWPTDNDYQPDCDLETHFPYFEFSAHPGHFHQRRAWKPLGQPVSLSPTAGHDVQFIGRRVFPYKFLLKHYPIRSEEHGRRKVLHEREQRWNRAERRLGWHRQYDGLRRFVHNSDSLLHFDAATFYEQWLVERLSGIGIFDAPPAWATPPVWTANAARELEPAASRARSAAAGTGAVAHIHARL